MIPKKWYSKGFRTITALSRNDAIEIFAGRLARRIYGRKAYCKMPVFAYNSKYHVFIGRNVGNKRIGHITAIIIEYS